MEPDTVTVIRPRGTGLVTMATDDVRITPTGTPTNRITRTRTNTAPRCSGSSTGAGMTPIAITTTPATSARPNRSRMEEDMEEQAKESESGIDVGIVTDREINMVFGRTLRRKKTANATTGCHVAMRCE